MATWPRCATPSDAPDPAGSGSRTASRPSSCTGATGALRARSSTARSAPRTTSSAPADPRRFRWYGREGELLPDAGDFLVEHGSDPEAYPLVHFATQVRGRQPWDLWLVVTPARIGDDGSIPDEVYERMLDPESRAFYFLYRRRARRA